MFHGYNIQNDVMKNVVPPFPFTPPPSPPPFTQDGYVNKKSLVNIDGKGYYSIYIAENVSISHGVLVHGPSHIKENTFVGFKSTIDGANIGSNVEIGAHSYIKNVQIPDNIAILPSAVITKTEDIEKYITPLSGINKKIIGVNQEMAVTYNCY